MASRKKLSEMAEEADRQKTGLHSRGRSFFAHNETLQSIAKEGATELQVSTEDCRLWPYNDRIYAGLNEENCKSLKEDIQLNTQIQPVVARIDPTGKKKYEIIVGTRRFWACQHIPGKTIKIMLIEADEKQAYKIMRSENEERDDISVYEKAINANRVIDDIYDGNQKSYCLDNKIGEGTLSNWMAIADMAPEIMAVIPNRLEINVKQATQVRSMINKSAKIKKAVLEKAASLKDSGLTTAQVFKQLIEAGQGALTTRKDKPIEKIYAVSGDKKGVQIKESKSGAISIKISKEAANNKKAVLKTLTAHLS
jgi:ParB/RepB/Spo0J family partition protein